MFILILTYIFIFLLGLAAGSFLNVVIFRLEKGGKIINDRSKCLHCGHILAWRDLVPVLSYLFLRGKCGYCKRAISIQYPLVELANGLLFVAIFNFQFSIFNKFSIFNFQSISNIQYLEILSLLFWLFITSALIVIFVYDFKHYIIPDKVVYPAIAVSLGFNLLNDLVTSYKLQVTSGNIQYPTSDIQSISNFQFLIYNLSHSIFVNHFLAAFAAGAFFYSIVVITRGKGMGGGDVKLAFLMGLVLGLSNTFLAVFLAFFIGSIIGLCLVFIGKKKMKNMVPFGPFLVSGTFIALFFGESILRWYLNIIY